MLYQQMQLGVPALWIQTKDFVRVSELIIKFNSRKYYTMNNGVFSLYSDNKWKPILIKISDPDTSEKIETVTSNITVAVDYLENQEEKSLSTFIINSLEDPKKTASEMSGLVSHLSSLYRHSFMNDNLDSMPYQIIIISPHVCPEEYSFLFVSVEDSYPSFEDLIEILNHINVSTNGEVIDVTKSKEIAKAGLGLNEFSFINYCLLSILNFGKISSDYVYKSKMSNVKKNGILEIIKPKITFDSIGGLDNIKKVIERNVFFWQNPEEAEKYGISPIRRILTVGVPGTGKSAICEATANALNLDLARTGVSQVMNSFIGQSEANMRAVFQQIKVMAPLCVWIDEFGRDLSGGASSSHVDGGTTDRVHGEFLTGLQELPDNVFLMCAANQLDNLKPEMLRAERFDKIFFVGLPAFEERIAILKIYLLEGDFNYELIARATKNFTGAEIKSLIKHVKFDVVSTFRRPINTHDILSHVSSMRNILWNKDRDMIKNLYRLAYDQWDWASTLQLNDIDDILGNRVQSSDSWEVKI